MSLEVIKIKVKRILYIGNYDENYSRNFVVLNALRYNNIKILKFNFKSSKKFVIFYHFFKNFKKLKSSNIDLIVFYSISPNDWFLFLLTKLFSIYRKIPMVYDIFISKLQTYYFDRKLYSNNIFSKIIKYMYFYLQDFFECRLSDLVLLDTDAHIKYFVNKFKSNTKKFRKIFVGASSHFKIKLDKKIIDENQEKISIGFWGTYIPLQGIEYIIKSANILKQYSKISFYLIGSGQTYEKNQKLAKSLNLKNIEFIDLLPLPDLVKYISKFDIGLGVFGKGEKVLCVIPNKIYQAIQMKIPVITSKTPAIEELFTNEKDILLCKRANPESLAKVILKLVNNTNLRLKIAENAFFLYKTKTSLKAIAKDVSHILSEL